MTEHPRYSNQDYTVGWLCALARSELPAAIGMLDKRHESPVNVNEDDENTYEFGEIGGHNVVIACMPPQKPGNLSAQKLVQPLKRSFPKMILHLFVGIGGGIPRNPPRRNPNEDIHLGDVVVGWAEQSGVPAVVQYDNIRQSVDEKVELLSLLDNPNRRLLNALNPIISDRVLGKTKFDEHLQRLGGVVGFQHPGIENDVLFEAGCDHVKIEPGPVDPGDSYCSRCDRGKIVHRPQRTETRPQFHLGTILSGEKVMQDPRRRDELSKLHHNAICIEMEAAGVNEDTHCLVIRGIADYADSHKFWLFHNYAAATAAAFAREILHKIRPVVVAKGDSGPNGLTIAAATRTFDMAGFASTMEQGEWHYGTAPPDRTNKTLTDARYCFARAESMLRESSNDDPSPNLRVYFRLMTVECDLSHNRALSIDERIQHIRQAEENGRKAWMNASVSQSATPLAQVRLEQAFVKGRMAELEEQKGETKDMEIFRVKEEVSRDMDVALAALGRSDGQKYMEYLERVGKWKIRLRPEG